MAAVVVRSRADVVATSTAALPRYGSSAAVCGHGQP